jgi:hypothetical protein
MATLGTLNDNIADMLARSDINSQITLEIQSAVRHYQSERFWFNEDRISLSCSSTITEYTLSATTSIMQIIAVQITRNSSTYVIEPISEAERLSYDTNNITGDPSWYAVYRGLFIPYPRPTTSPYTATISVVREPVTLSATTDSNVFTNNAQELIESRAAANICLRYLRDQEAAKSFKILEQEALMELRKRSSRLTPKRIIPTQF